MIDGLKSGLGLSELMRFGRPGCAYHAPWDASFALHEKLVHRVRIKVQNICLRRLLPVAPPM